MKRPARRQKRTTPIGRVRRYINGLLRSASKQRRKVLESARHAMQRLYGR